MLVGYVRLIVARLSARRSAFMNSLANSFTPTPFALRFEHRAKHPAPSTNFRTHPSQNDKAVSQNDYGNSHFRQMMRSGGTSLSLCSSIPLAHPAGDFSGFGTPSALLQGSGMETASAGSQGNVAKFNRSHGLVRSDGGLGLLVRSPNSYNRSILKHFCRVNASNDEYPNKLTVHQVVGGGSNARRKTKTTTQCESGPPPLVRPAPQPSVLPPLWLGRKQLREFEQVAGLLVFLGVPLAERVLTRDQKFAV